MTTDRPRVVIGEALNAARSALGDGVEALEEADLWSRGEDLVRAVAGAPGLVVRNQTLVDGPLLAAAPRLRVVGRLGAGLDSIDRSGRSAYRSAAGQEAPVSSRAARPARRPDGIQPRAWRTPAWRTPPS